MIYGELIADMALAPVLNIPMEMFSHALRSNDPDMMALALTWEGVLGYDRLYWQSEGGGEDE